jgi:hypothetical protein
LTGVVRAANSRTRSGQLEKECEIVPILAHRPQYFRRGSFGDRQAQQLHPPSQRDGERGQAAERMADEMHRAGRAPDHRFKNLCLVSNIGIESDTAFDSAAITEQTRGDTAETVLPLRDDGPPCSSGAA